MLPFGAEWAGWIYKGLAMLLICHPCALVISTPAAIAASLAASARRGTAHEGRLCSNRSERHRGLS